MASVERKPRVILEEFRVKNAADDCGYADEKWSFKKFRKNFRIVIVRLNELEIEFDLIGMPTAFANAFRRLMLSEVPSMAIEKVIISNNTSIIQDEVLAHRLGLIPLKADPRLFEFRPENATEGTEFDTLEFNLKVKCKHLATSSQAKESHRHEDLYENYVVYSSAFQWLPIGNQTSMHTDASVGPVHPDILIAKMRPKHEIDLKMIAVKGIGKDHAKFSPVATATYRLLPEVRLKSEISGHDAVVLQSCFSAGVITIDDDGKAEVRDARYDNCNRNIFRYPEIAESVELTRVRDHFIFNVESVGALPPDIIFVEAVRVLKNKCRVLLDELNSFS